MDAGVIIGFFFFALPIGSVVWFLVSLIGFCVVKARRKADPNRYPERLQTTWRRNLIVSAIVAAVLMAFFVGVLLLLVAAVAHM